MKKMNLMSKTETDSLDREQLTVIGLRLEGLSKKREKKEKKLMNTDNTMVTPGRRRLGRGGGVYRGD